MHFILLILFLSILYLAIIKTQYCKQIINGLVRTGSFMLILNSLVFTQTYIAHTITTNANGASSVFAIDVDSDGDMDVLSASSGDDKIVWYESVVTMSITATNGSSEVSDGEITNDSTLTLTFTASESTNDLTCGSFLWLCCARLVLDRYWKNVLTAIIRVRGQGEERFIHPRG